MSPLAVIRLAWKDHAMIFGIESEPIDGDSRRAAHVEQRLTTEGAALSAALGVPVAVALRD